MATETVTEMCFRFGHWLTLCTLNIHLLTYLLTIKIYKDEITNQNNRNRTTRMIQIKIG